MYNCKVIVSYIYEGCPINFVAYSKNHISGLKGLCRLKLSQLVNYIVLVGTSKFQPKIFTPSIFIKYLVRSDKIQRQNFFKKSSVFSRYLTDSEFCINLLNV